MGSIRWSYALFASIFIVAGLFLAFGGASGAWSQHVASGWPTVQGEVISSQIEESSSGKGGRHYSLTVSYRYTINGQAYEGSGAPSTEDSKLVTYSSSKYLVEQTREKFFPGAPIVLHVNPENPNMSSPSSGIKGDNFIIVGAGLLVSLIGAAFFRASAFTNTNPDESGIKPSRQSKVPLVGFFLIGLPLCIAFVAIGLFAPWALTYFVFGVFAIFFIRSLWTFSKRKSFDTILQMAESHTQDWTLFANSMKKDWKEYIPGIVSLLIWVGISGIIIIFGSMGHFYFFFMLSLSLLCFYQGFKEYGKVRTIANIPTSNVRSVAMGLVEVKGKAYPLDYYFEGYTPPQDGKIWLRPLLMNPQTLSALSIQNGDPKGFAFLDEMAQIESKFSKSTYYGPMFVMGPSKEYIRNPNNFDVRDCFWVEDSTGKILVDSYAANVNSSEAIINIPIGAPVYVIGDASPFQSDHPSMRDAKLIIRKNRFADPMLISLKGEREFLSQEKFRARFMIGMGGIIGAGMIIIILSIIR